MSRSIGRILAKSARFLTYPMPSLRGDIALATLGEAALPVLRPSFAPEIQLRCASDKAALDVHLTGESDHATLDWARGLGADAILWDIGANVGVIALVAAQAGARVIAFEPVAASYAALVRNTHLNALGERLTALPVALNDRDALVEMQLRSMVAGHSLQSVETAINQFGETYMPIFAQGCIALRGDSLRRQFGLRAPTHIKLDVDGREPEILDGLSETLRDTTVREIVIELEGDAARVAGLREALNGKGFQEDKSFRDRRNGLFRRA